MMYLMVPFPQCPIDVNHNQPMKDCVNTEPRSALSWKHVVSVSGL